MPPKLGDKDQIVVDVDAIRRTKTSSDVYLRRGLPKPRITGDDGIMIKKGDALSALVALARRKKNN